MRKYFSKKFFVNMAVFLLLALCTVKTFAIENDYKNNLLKVDINKTGSDNYKIELFTQKPYNEPVRVIKKSDTRYYIFLPETSHSITSAAASGNVKSVDVELHPYPGQDLNNGYTRINITTDKPVTFSTSVKTASTATPSKIDQQKLAQLDSVFEEQNKKVVKQKPVTTDVKPITIPEVQNTANIPKQNAKTYQNSKTPQTQAPAKPAMKTIVVDTSEKIQPKDTQTVEETLPVIASKPSTKLEEVTDEDLINDDSKALEQAAKEQGLTEIATGEQEVIPELTIVDRAKLAVKKAYHMAMNNLWMISTLLLLFVALLLLKSSKKKGKEQDGMDKILTPSSSENSLNKVEEKPAEPTLVTYESPTSSKTYSYELYEVGQKAQNKTFAELTSEPKPEVASDSSVAQAVADDTNEDEANVLAASVISDETGFCLVNFEGSVSLIGYIGDDIFVLHNFGNISVFNPSIQYRLAEKNENEAFYIVKTADTKLMVKVTTDKMSLEMIM